MGDFFDVNNEINAVEDGAREAFAVLFDLMSGAGAFLRGVVEMAAGAGVHSGDEDEIRRVGDALIGASDGDLTVFKGLTQRFKDASGKFRNLV